MKIRLILKLLSFFSETLFWI